MSSLDDRLVPRNLTRIRRLREEPRESVAANRDPAHVERAAASKAVIHYDREALGAFIVRGGNPLLAAAAPLLTLGARFQTVTQHDDIDGLHRQVMNAIETFERQTRDAGADAAHVELAMYALCTYIDTAVYRTLWGAESNWSARPALDFFFGEAIGGKKFFEIVERTMTQPRRYIELLELLYVCLALGYEGKYRSERGKLMDVQDQLARTIRRQRGGLHDELSPHWQGVGNVRQRVWNLTPWWIVALAAVVALVGLGITLQSRLWAQVSPVAGQLVQHGLSLSFRPSAEPVRSRLRPLLAEEERAGRITIEEDGGRTHLVLAAADLFASGSAMPNAAYATLLERIGAAANQVPGRLTVVGHSDDQPIRSLQYRDNFELSRARAFEVAQLLQRELADPGRVDWVGAGSSQPRFDDRARNRRVEIVHISAGGLP